MNRTIQAIRVLFNLANDRHIREPDVPKILEEARRLLMEHNTERKLPESRDESVHQLITEVMFGRAHHKQWQVRIWHGASELLFCRYFFTRPEGGLQHHVIGRWHNAEAAAAAATFLVNVCLRESNYNAQGTGKKVVFRRACARRLRALCMGLKSYPTHLYRTERDLCDAWFVVNQLAVKIDRRPTTSWKQSQRDNRVICGTEPR